MTSDSNPLTDRHIEDFIRCGATKLERAFSPELAAACRHALWSELGISPDRPETWKAPVVRVDYRTGEPFSDVANSPRLHAAYDQLVGEGRWIAPTGLGTFPIRFPSTMPPTDDGWHVDMSFGIEDPDFLNWRVNVASRGRSLLMLFLLSDVREDDAPTRIRLGSHAKVARRLLPHGHAGLRLRDLAENAFSETADCEEVLATGTAGTVWLCHPFVVHAAQAHRGSAPRIMAQPPLLPAHDFDPALPPSPVQTAIRRACGLTI